MDRLVRLAVVLAALLIAPAAMAQTHSVTLVQFGNGIADTYDICYSLTSFGSCEQYIRWDNTDGVFILSGNTRVSNSAPALYFDDTDVAASNANDATLLPFVRSATGGDENVAFRFQGQADGTLSTIADVYMEDNAGELEGTLSLKHFSGFSFDGLVSYTAFGGGDYGMKTHGDITEWRMDHDLFPFVTNTYVLGSAALAWLSSHITTLFATTIDEVDTIEFLETDSYTDCSAFSATGGGIFYDDSEGKFKKCQDNTLTDLAGAGTFPGFTDIDTDYGNETVTSDWIFRGAGSTGAMGAYDLEVGDSTSYGGLRLGDMGLYHSSYSSGATIDLDGSFVMRNEGTLGVSNDPGIEFAFMEAISNTIRLAIPESGSGNATAFIRSGTFAGPYSIATGNDIVLCDQWTAYDSNIDCDTSATGADLFVQDDLEVEGTIYAHETINLEGATADGNQVIIQVGADPGADVTITLPTSTGTLSTGAHTTDTNANTLCTGSTTYLDGEGNCDPFSPTDDTVLTGNGTGWDSKTIPDCNAAEQALNYVQATNTWTCQSHPMITDTNANTICTGTNVYLDGEGNCDTITGGMDIKSGEINITEGTPGTVTFSTAFSSAPWCTCTLEQAVTDATCWISTDATTTSVSFDVDNSAGGAGNYDVNWICTNAGNP